MGNVKLCIGYKQIRYDKNNKDKNWKRVDMIAPGDWDYYKKRPYQYKPVYISHHDLLIA